MYKNPNASGRFLSALGATNVEKMKVRSLHPLGLLFLILYFVFSPIITLFYSGNILGLWKEIADEFTLW